MANPLKIVKRKTKKVIKDIVLWNIFPRAYKQGLKDEIIPGSALFLGRTSDDMPDSFTLLFKRFESKEGPKPEFCSCGYGRLNYAAYWRNCLNIVKTLGKYNYIFLDDASDIVSCLPIRKETKVIQLWHGCGAFKKWGMSTADLLFGGSFESKRRHPFYENLSLVTISSPEVKWAYAEAMDLEGRDDIVLPIGVSRTDVFFDEDFIARARAKTQEVVPQTKSNKVILYAPTFRGRATGAEAPDELDIKMLKGAFEGEYVLLIKNHPFVKKPTEISEDCREFAFDVSQALDIENLLCVADVCISDYSSLVFEYSLFEKPMIFFAYDKSDYDDWRGFYYDYEELTPGPVVVTTEEIVEYISHLDTLFDANVVKAFRNKFMSACDGHSTDRIFEYVTKG